jgi:PST family polysaccharide transporter
MKRQIISGIGWTSAGRVVRELNTFVIGIMLARLLEPEMFGLIGMVFVFSNFADQFSDLGLTGAIVQRKEIREEQLSTIFWINMAVGLLVGFILMACSPLIAAFYHEDQLVPITVVIGAVIGFGTLNDVQTALLQRNMQFYRQTMINISSGVVAGVVAVGMALAGCGVWSLVAQFVVNTVVGTLVMWITTSWKPRLIFNFHSVRELLGYSANLQGARVSDYLVHNIDNFMVGRFLDVYTLGIYRMAYKYMFMLNQLMVPTLRPVLIPTLSRIQDDHDRLKPIYIKISQVIAFLSVPLAVGLIVTADSFVLSLLGPKWIDVIPLLRVLGIATIVLPVMDYPAWLLVVLGRADKLVRWRIIDGVISTTFFFIGVQFGVYGVAWAFVLRTAILFYPLTAIPARLIGLSFSDYIRKLLPIFLISALMGLSVWGLSLTVLAGLPALPRLIIQTGLGGAIYGLLAIALRLETLHDIIRLLPR